MENKKKKITLTRLIILGAFIYTIFILANQHNTYKELKSEYDGLKQQQQEMEDNKTSLEDELLNLDSMEYIEKVAREELGLVKEGEKVFVDVAKE